MWKYGSRRSAGLVKMAIRYSGDVEIRMEYGGAGYISGDVVFDPNGSGFYYAHVRAPRIRNSAILSLKEVGLSDRLSRKQATTSESYDTAARAFLKWSELHVGELPVELDRQNRILIRRVFQSPCPVRFPRNIGYPAFGGANPNRRRTGPGES